jgi:hypothetical protein
MGVCVSRERYTEGGLPSDNTAAIVPSQLILCYPAQLVRRPVPGVVHHPNHNTKRSKLLLWWRMTSSGRVASSGG